MPRWANYLISGVTYDSSNIISKIVQHKDKDEGIGKGIIVDREVIAKNLRSGKTYATIFKRLSEFQLGKKIHYPKAKGHHYIRIDTNQAEYDYLGDLLNVEEIKAVLDAEEQKMAIEEQKKIDKKNAEEAAKREEAAEEAAKLAIQREKRLKSIELEEALNIIEESHVETKKEASVDASLQEINESEKTSNEPEKKILSFIDVKKGPEYYFKRYIFEPGYKQWFEKNYPEYTIYEAVGLTELEYAKIISKIKPEPEPDPKSTDDTDVIEVQELLDEQIHNLESQIIELQNVDNVTNENIKQEKTLPKGFEEKNEDEKKIRLEEKLKEYENEFNKKLSEIKKSEIKVDEEKIEEKIESPYGTMPKDYDNNNEQEEAARQEEAKQLAKIVELEKQVSEAEVQKAAEEAEAQKAAEEAEAREEAARQEEEAKQLAKIAELEKQLNDAEERKRIQRQEEEAKQLAKIAELEKQLNDAEERKRIEEDDATRKIAKIAELEKQVEKAVEAQNVSVEDELEQQLNKLQEIENKVKNLGSKKTVKPSSVQSNIAKDIQAYCVKCKSKRTVKNPEETIMKNGRPAIKGKCSVCDTKVFRIGKVSK